MAGSTRRRSWNISSRAGFDVERMYGAPDRSPLTDESPDLIVAAARES